MFPSRGRRQRDPTWCTSKWFAISWSKTNETKSIKCRSCTLGRSNQLQGCSLNPEKSQMFWDLPWKFRASLKWHIKKKHALCFFANWYKFKSCDQASHPSRFFFRLQLWREPTLQIGMDRRGVEDWTKCQNGIARRRIDMIQQTHNRQYPPEN